MLFSKIAKPLLSKLKGSWLGPISSYYGNGHMKFTCPCRRIDPHIIKNTYPVQQRAHVKHFWIVKVV